MAEATERDFETAAAVVEQERGEALARIRDALAAEGEDDCIDCGRPIAAARKAALPSAERCIACQTAHEQRSSRGY